MVEWKHDFGHFLDDLGHFEMEFTGFRLIYFAIVNPCTLW